MLLVVFDESCIITLISVHSYSRLEIKFVLLSNVRFKVLSRVEIGSKTSFIEAAIVSKCLDSCMLELLFLCLRFQL